MIRKIVILIFIFFFFIIDTPTAQGLTVTNHSSSQPEIWMAFFHGLGGNLTVNIPLIENISKNLQKRGILLKYINPSLPNDVNLEEWSNNIAEAIDAWQKNETQTQPWIILVGHSMGGKACLHAVAKNLKNIDNYVLSVITINSPIKNIGKYRPFTYFWNGMLLHLIAEYVLHTHKVVALEDCRDIDTSIDGKKWLSLENRTWISLISGEAYPTDTECDLQIRQKKIDMYPRYMDDGLVPLDAQYTEDSTTIYYGTCWHQAMLDNPDAINSLANIIVKYLTGESVNISLFHNAWTYDHESRIPSHWNDTIGRDEIFLDSGHISHTAGILPPYEWTDTVGGFFVNKRNRYELQQTSGIGSRITNVSWVIMILMIIDLILLLNYYLVVKSN